MATSSERIFTPTIIRMRVRHTSFSIMSFYWCVTCAMLCFAVRAYERDTFSLRSFIHFIGRCANPNPHIHTHFHSSIGLWLCKSHSCAGVSVCIFTAIPIVSCAENLFLSFFPFWLAELHFSSDQQNYEHAIKSNRFLFLSNWYNGCQNLLCLWLCVCVCATCVYIL